MGCLYCGKEIGPFRSLRDSEFCSVAHRDRYHNRLGRALDRLSAAEPAPAGIAGFRVQFPIQEGAHPQFTFSPLAPAGPLPDAAESLRLSAAVPLSGPRNNLYPQPVVPGAAPLAGALDSVPVPLRLPSQVSPSGATLLLAFPQGQEALPIQDPEPVERFLLSSVCGIIEPAAAVPGIAAVRPDSMKVPAAAGPVPACLPEPAERFLLPSVCGIMEPAAVAPGIAALHPIRTFMPAMPAAAGPVPAPRPEPVVVDVFPHLDSRPAIGSAAPAIPGFALRAVEEIAARPQPAPLRPSQPAPAWVGPTPVPVRSLAAIPAFAAAAPGIAAVRATSTFVPAAAGPVLLSRPEPALVDVFPLLDPRPAIRHVGPAILRFSLHPVDEIAARPKPVLLRSSQPAPAWAGPAPVPVESMPAVLAFAAVAAAAPAVGVRLHEFSSRALVAAPPRLAPLTGRFVPGLRPMAVESMPAVALAVPVPLAPPLPVRCPALAHFLPAQEGGDVLAAPAPAPGPDVVETLPAAAAVVVSTGRACAPSYPPAA